MNTASFVGVFADGMIERMVYGYENDVVIQMEDTMYFSTANLTVEDKASLETLRAKYDGAGDFCTATLDRGTNYYTMTLTFTNMDDPSNMPALYELDIISNPEIQYISMELSETGLLADGFVKK